MSCLYRQFSELACIHGKLTSLDKPSRLKCGWCKWYEPPLRMVRTCNLWIVDGKVCLKSASACTECEYYEHSAPTEARVSREEARRTYYNRNRERLLQEAKEWVATNREKRREYMREYMRRRRARGRQE